MQRSWYMKYSWVAKPWRHAFKCFSSRPASSRVSPSLVAQAQTLSHPWFNSLTTYNSLQSGNCVGSAFKVCYWSLSPCCHHSASQRHLCLNSYDRFPPGLLCLPQTFLNTVAKEILLKPELSHIILVQKCSSSFHAKNQHSRRHLSSLIPCSHLFLLSVSTPALVSLAPFPAWNLCT